VTPTGLKAWFGADGIQPSQSLAAFAGEPARGRWKLDVRTRSGRLVRWSVAADLSPSTTMAGMETSSEYGESGCDCRMGSDHDSEGLFVGFLLLGLALLLRHR
jgi:MYXO-CTERM domain-containing protein